MVATAAYLPRTIARGGRQLTDSIARIWRLSWTQAETAKHQDGFVASALEPAQSEAWSRIHEALVPELSPLVRDLRQTLLACRAKTGATAESLLLVGGRSRLRGLASYLTEQLQLPVRLLAPADDHAILGPRLQSMGARADIAFLAAGIAFEGAGGRGSFDLRQGDLSFKADLSFLRAKAMPLAAAAIVVVAFAAISAYANLYKLRKSEDALSRRLALESAEFSLAAVGRPGAAAGVAPGGRQPDAEDDRLRLCSRSARRCGQGPVQIDVDEVTSSRPVTISAVSAKTDRATPAGHQLLRTRSRSTVAGKQKCSPTSRRPRPAGQGRRTRSFS